MYAVFIDVGFRDHAEIAHTFLAGGTVVAPVLIVVVSVCVPIVVGLLEQLGELLRHDGFVVFYRVMFSIR